MAEAILDGIDVSHYQDEIDWAQVATAGKAFAFIKATDGNGGTDSRFKANWEGARGAGIRRGAYHFFRAVTDAVQQAQRFIVTMGSDWGELPSVLDFELLGNASVEQALQGAKRWMDLVEQASGSKPIVYTGPAFWSGRLHDSTLFSEYPLWIAHYTAGSEPKLPSAWQRWTFWQHSEQGEMPGITGPVDLDRFHGNLMELDALARRIELKSAIAGS